MRHLPAQWWLAIGWCFFVSVSGEVSGSARVTRDNRSKSRCGKGSNRGAFWGTGCHPIVRKGGTPVAKKGKKGKGYRYRKCSHRQVRLSGIRTEPPKDNSKGDRLSS
jgi:hypothetical protein